MFRDKTPTSSGLNVTRRPDSIWGDDKCARVTGCSACGRRFALDGVTQRSPPGPGPELGKCAGSVFGEQGPRAGSLTLPREAPEGQDEGAEGRCQGDSPSVCSALTPLVPSMPAFFFFLHPVKAVLLSGQRGKGGRGRRRRSIFLCWRLLTIIWKSP